MSDIIAIASVLIAGVVTPSVVAYYAFGAQRRGDARTEREHQITRTEDALNNVDRERRLLHAGFSMWRQGADPYAPHVVENHDAIVEAIEAVWLSENQLRIRFGEDSPVYVVYRDVVQAIGQVKEVYQRGVTTPATADDLVDWQAADSALVREKKRFVRTVREVLMMPSRDQAWWRAPGR